MIQPPDDPKLTHFLQQHRPPVPPPAPNLEDRILAAVSQTQPERSPLRLRVMPNWAVPGAIAASVLVAIAGYRLLQPANPTIAEQQAIESFIEASWQGALNDSSEDDIFPSTDSDTN
jgi:hypothetical protein